MERRPARAIPGVRRAPCVLGTSAAALLLVAVCAATGCGDGGDDPDPPPPNIVLVLVDALRRDHVGLYGYPRPTTPFLDELGRGGVVFDDAFAQAPQTLNSTASLFTSRRFPLLLRGVTHAPIPGIDPAQREQWARTPRLAAANLTLAEMLRDGGYDTVAVFTNPHHHATSGFGQGFERARLLEPDPAKGSARFATVLDELCAWRDERRDSARPYFAYLHLMDVHNPYRPPDRYRRLFAPGPGRDLYVNGRPDAGFTDADLAAMTALYDGEIRFVDDGLRRLVHELDRRGDLERTILVITADHGDELMDHGGLGHGMTVELELLRIPLVISGEPLRHAAGRRIPELVRNLDLAPTLVELAGLPVPAELEGDSLVPLIAGSQPAASTDRVSYAWISSLRSLTTARWHCTRDLAEGSLALYDRREDPQGLDDVAAEHPELDDLCRRVTRRLEGERLESVRRAELLKAVETGAEPPPDGDAVLEQLRALGYAE